MPRLLNHILVIADRPIRFVWNEYIPTAEAYSDGNIRMNPAFFLEGQSEVGFGVAYHEASHLRYSPYCTELMGRARDVAPSVQYVMNIILDRKDDMCNAQDHPGFAWAIWGRLPYIATLDYRRQNRKMIDAWIAKARQEDEAFAALSDAEAERHVVRMIMRQKPPPVDPYQDFFLVAKVHRKPYFDVTRDAMQHIASDRLFSADPDALLAMAKRVRDTLGVPEDETVMAEFLDQRAEPAHDDETRKETIRILNKISRSLMAKSRKRAMQALGRLMQNQHPTASGPLTAGTGRVNMDIPVGACPRDPEHRDAYETIRETVRTQVGALVRRLKRAGHQSISLYGQQEGDELDIASSVAQIATGQNPYYITDIAERSGDIEMHLAIDASGSMGHKNTVDRIEPAKRIGVLFSEAMRALPACRGRLWSFNVHGVIDYGPPDPESGFVAIKPTGNNADTRLLQVAGERLLQSEKTRRVLIMLCDDCPDDPELAGRMSRELLERGVLVVHILVGVHGTPSIYPVELVYTSLADCLDEFGQILETIVDHA